MKKVACCCFTRIAFTDLNFTAAFLLIKKTWDGQFVISVHTPHPLSIAAGGGVEPPTKNSRGLTGLDF